MSRRVALCALKGLRSGSTTQAISPAVGACTEQLRWHGGGVPEFWGRDSPYHPGTAFLGTPKNHLELVATRPLAPHVFEIDGKQYKFHYKMPVGAISSIANRATGVMLSVGAGAAGIIALTSDLGAGIEALKASSPLLLVPIKFLVAFPLSYHYLAGVRHLYWDHYKYGNQADKASPLEVPAVAASSTLLLASGAAAAAALSVYSM